MKKILILVLLLIFFKVNLSFSNDAKKYLREGNKLYKENKFNEAEIQYRKSLELKNNNKGVFNLGDALYKQGNYKEAAEKFKEVALSSKDKETIANAYHNLGNSYFQSQDYQNAIDAYINALRKNPNDDDTRYNLEMARKFLKLQQQSKQNQNNQQNQQNQNNNQQNQNQQNQQNNQNQQNQNQNKQQNQQNQNNNQEDQNQQNQNTREAPNQDQKGTNKDIKISKEDAERILNAIMKEEQEIQKKVRKEKSTQKKLEKNW